MKIETISYKRVKNLGNFQSETMEVMATLESEDLPEDVAKNLKLFVHSQLYPPTPDNTPDSF
ncbi:MAG: hypothetical protein V7K26_00185 [Nostoc sp.]|uniref:hypothetical protein n=1 Tax=Nostoc sp. TaxID=1180 RepID=UPI002FF0DC3D